jgi:hypothetical protein
MEQRTLKNVNNHLNINIYSYLETSGGQSSNIFLNVVHFLTPVLVIHLWQLKTVVFLPCLPGFGSSMMSSADIRYDDTVKYKGSNL